MVTQPANTWKFISPMGDFQLKDPHRSNFIYFPLVNEAGMMSAVTPNLHGDAKINQHAFLLPPVSVEDLHASRYNRNFWVYVLGVGGWSATGNSALQIATDEDEVSMDAGFLWHKIIRENMKLSLRAEIINFVPSNPDKVELMKVTISNTGSLSVTLTPTAAIPLYGRSADNLRDHRNVTALLHRARCEKYGVSVRPTLSFDERGHHPNQLTYSVLGAEEDGTAPVGFFPVLEDFIGEGGTFDWPRAIITPDTRPISAGNTMDGYETLGGLRFRQVILQPGESRSYILILAILEQEESPLRLVQTYATDLNFCTSLEQTQAYWHSNISALTVQTGDTRFNSWFKWVTLQPILRRLYGCSFLPYHDYGRGGRGWRDLWQDILALLLMEKGSVDDLLFGNFAGVRMDGSNATIIGNQPGEFKADRNNIPRVWMDHGTWPLMTTQLYIDQTGDLDFLLRQQKYFKDIHVYRCQEIDLNWDEDQGTIQRTENGSISQGSILEHLLVQHLTVFFHVGEHNNILLEGADWNDGMDMAREKGESVAFSAFYASNLRQLSHLVLELNSRGSAEIELAEELVLLLDTLNNPVNYASPKAKHTRLLAYFASVKHTASGNKVRLAASQLAADLQSKADWLVEHIQKNEWVQHADNLGWFNGYYDNDGLKLEGDRPNEVRMTLTGQVFPLMGGIATDDQARQQILSVEKYLYAPELHGYRLNTDFGEVKLNMGRCFGYAFGHKENGAMFSHMAVMYAYALYKRGFVREGYRVLDGIYQQSIDFPNSRMYPGIPEYFNNRGRGMYPYLTGSASWYLLTFVTRVYGVYGILGDLALEPKLVKEQFDSSGIAGLITLFAGKKLELIYQNHFGLDYGCYQIGKVILDDVPVSYYQALGVTVLPRSEIVKLDDTRTHRLVVHLEPKRTIYG